MSELDDLMNAFADNRAGTREFTLHVDFLAVDVRHARSRAEQYVRALNFVRAEVDCFRARVSEGPDWSRAESVFCLAPGPHPDDVCLGSAKHSGNHTGPGPSWLWDDDQVPRAPDTIAGTE